MCIALAEDAIEQGSPDLDAPEWRGPRRVLDLMTEYFADRIGEHRLNGDPDLLARIFMGMMFQLVVARKLWGNDPMDHGTIDAIVDVFLNGVLRLVETRTEAPRTSEGRGTPPPPPLVNDRGDEIKPPPPARRRPPVIAIIAGAVVLIAVLIWGIRFLAYATTHETTDDARVDADTVTITSKISERVSQILTDTNDTVHKGEVLILLDNRDERTQLRASARAGGRAAGAGARRATERRAHGRTAEARKTRKARAASKRPKRKSATRKRCTSRRSKRPMRPARPSPARKRSCAWRRRRCRAPLRPWHAPTPTTSAIARSRERATPRSSSSMPQRATQAQALSQYRAALDQVTSAQTNVAQAQARQTAAMASATAAAAGIGAGEGQLETAQGHLSESAAPSRVPAVAAQANAAQAQVKSAGAQAQTARDQLNYTVIRSPIDGIVGAKNVEVGATVAPGQALLELVPRSGIYITANYKETQLGNMKVGQDVDVCVDAYKGTTFHGRVDSIGPASQNTFSLIPAQNATGNFVKVTQRLPVRIAIVDAPADKPLRVGMSVETSVKVK